MSNLFRYEMGKFDLPAVITYILANTNSSKLYYVGYSQGTTSLMVMLSEFPEYNNKIYAASLMAPVGGIYYADSIFKLFTLAIPILKVISTQIPNTICIAIGSNEVAIMD